MLANILIALLGFVVLVGVALKLVGFGEGWEEIEANEKCQEIQRQAEKERDKWTGPKRH